MNTYSNIASKLKNRPMVACDRDSRNVYLVQVGARYVASYSDRVGGGGSSIKSEPLATVHDAERWLRAQGVVLMSDWKAVPG